MGDEMAMRLRGRLRLSSALPGEGDRAISDFMADEVPGILAKGAPEGKGPSVDSFQSEGDSILLNISSTRYVRAHEALLRLKKALAGMLGKQFRLGVRSAHVDEYSISFPLDHEPLRPFDLPLTDSVAFDGRTCTLTFKDIDEEFLSHNYIDRVIKLAGEKAHTQHYEGKGEHWELLWT